MIETRAASMHAARAPFERTIFERTTPARSRCRVFAVVVTCLAAACAAPPLRPPDPARALLDAGIAAAGGAQALSRVRNLHWTGEATVFADQPIELRVDTRVQPFVRARSETWLRDRGRATLRILEVTPDAGWMVRDNERAPMPPPMLAHERLQYATYGVMLLAPLRAPEVALRRGPDVDGLRVLHAEHPDAAPAELFFDAEDRLVRLENVVPNPDGDGVVRQRFDFEGTIEAAGVRWPRIVRIAQDGRPFFELRIATLSVE